MTNVAKKKKDPSAAALHVAEAGVAEAGVAEAGVAEAGVAEAGIAKPGAPEVVDSPGDVSIVSMDGEGNAESPESTGELISHPTKLIRIASMVRNMLEEVRHAPLDDPGRRRLREIHERSLVELADVLSPELRRELGEFTLPFDSATPTESEIRVAQAQLVGWLEGLFHGIQASLMTQQQLAAVEVDEIRRRRAIESGTPVPERNVGPYL